MARRHVLWLSMLLLAGTVTVMVSGCSPGTRHRILSTLFEGVPKPGEADRSKPVVRRPRHPSEPQAAPSPAVVEIGPLEEPAKPAALPSWAEVSRTLPKDAAGGIDWVRAIEEKAITPSPGLDPAAKDQPVFPLDVELTPDLQPLFKVKFPHKAHTQWLACTNCHTAIFQMQRGADPITMAKIFAGEYCGRCHGKVSFAVPTGCPRCHPALGGAR